MNKMTLMKIFLGSVEWSGESQWHATVCLNKDVEFKLDTRAEVTVISENTFSKWSNVKLKKPTKALYGPTELLLKVHRIFSILDHFLQITCVRNERFKNQFVGTSSYHCLQSHCKSPTHFWFQRDNHQEVPQGLSRSRNTGQRIQHTVLT